MTLRNKTKDLHTDGQLKVVVIGGGTGNSTILSGLKPYIGDNLTAVVNTFDDGGGTGRIRAEYGGIAVGDLRQCARAMSDLHTDALAVLEGRFGAGTGTSGMNLEGQTVGNLILEQAHQMFAGDPERIANTYSDIYRIRGRVLPVSHDSRQLRITTVEGDVLEGEHVAELTQVPSLMGATIGFDRQATISPHADKAIRQADIVVLAPGDLYTSLAPTLAVKGMKEAMDNAKFIVLVANLMNRDRHTAGFSVADYAKEYGRISGSRIDRVLYNTGPINRSALRAQARLGSFPVAADAADFQADTVFIAIGADLVSHEAVMPSPNDPIAVLRSTIRHDSHKVAKAIMGIHYMSGLLHDLAISEPTGVDSHN